VSCGPAPAASTTADRIWGVRSGPDVYIRSAYGPQNGWFRRAAGTGAGRVRAGGIERDVSFERLDEDSPVHDAIDAAYHAKYDSYGPQIVGTDVGLAGDIGRGHGAAAARCPAG
jgi:hypothetical protein